MIVPRSRLLFWVAIVVLPFALLGIVEPTPSAVALLAIGGLVVVVVVDAASARNGLNGVSVELPKVTRMSKDREGKLEVRLRNELQKQKTVRLALALPREIESEQEDTRVALPAGTEWSRFDWNCLPRRRGNYRLAAARIETSSPLGFWDARRKLATQS
jgi:uncharacterized protein (DUF58 family)